MHQWNYESQNMAMDIFRNMEKSDFMGLQETAAGDPEVTATLKDLYFELNIQSDGIYAALTRINEALDKPLTEKHYE